MGLLRQLTDVCNWVRSRVFLDAAPFSPETGKGPASDDAGPEVSFAIARRSTRRDRGLFLLAVAGCRDLGFGLLLGLNQALAGQHRLADFLGDVLVVLEELLGVLAALAEPHRAVVVPGAALLNDVGRHREVDQVALV